MKTCKIAGKCGGCNYLTIDYKKQLDIKKHHCIDLIKKEKLTFCKVADTVGIKNPYHYRNKIIVAFNNKYEYGLYQENTHQVIPYDRCLMHEEVSDNVIKKIQMIIKKYRVSIYDEKRNKGLLRHVLIRRAIKTDQTMVVLVCNESVFKGSKNFCNELIKACPSVKTVVLNVNKRKTSVVLGNEEKVLYGKGFIVDKLCGLQFKISPSSFYQINHEQCENLYIKALSLVGISNRDVVVDTYCGIGTIGMVAAKTAKSVIGVEVNKEAIKDANINAKMNSISNIRFVNDDASNFMRELASKKQKVDIVIMDPPRAGSTKVFMDAVAVLKPKKVVYISCDPTTQMRDLSYFKRIGYKFDTLYPYDMFPHTSHVETVVLMSKV